MKLFSNKHAPNPRRVRMFLAEKGIAGVEIVETDIDSRENLSEPFLAMNPLGWLPVLELDDGAHLAESMAICRYFDELVPEPALFGSGALERARIEQWNRHMEFELLGPIGATFRNTHRFWAGKIEQVPAWGEHSRKLVEKRLDWLDTELDGKRWITGENFTVADITALAAIDFGRVSKIRIGDERPQLSRWYTAVNERPSSKA